MSIAPSPAAPPKPPAAASQPAAVIRSVHGTDDRSTKQLLKKHVPAWVISGAVHVALIGTLIAIDTMLPPVQASPQSEQELTVVADDKADEEKPEILTNPDVGLDAELPATVEVEREDKVNVVAEVVPNEAVGVPDSQSTAVMDVNPPAGVGDPSATTGIAGDAGAFMQGVGGGGTGTETGGFNGRSGASKDALLKAGGGSNATEAAVARGLIWLAGKQKANGSWQFDGNRANESAAATGLALLPFLAAGQTHKAHKDNKYQKQVEAGVKYLLSQQKPDGSFNGPKDHYMYAHAIATVSLCELLGMTGDRGRLLQPTQLAVNYIVSAQADDGSWGYTARTNGDTSIVGWQIQALHSAKLCKELTVPKATFEKARSFLDKVAGAKKETYGYRDRNPSLTLTPVGLLCRYYADGWGPNNPGMSAGVKFVMDRRMPSEKVDFNMYYYYYATQVLHFFDGPEWHKQWNPAMRDLLLARQAAQGSKDAGSWDGDPSITGQGVGRLGTTCLSLLTLEVYYRHLPLYKRDTAGLRELERAR